MGLVSFGFRDRQPPKAHLTIDCRFLSNPNHRIELCARASLDPEVQAHVFSTYSATELPASLRAKAAKAAFQRAA